MSRKWLLGVLLLAWAALPPASLLAYEGEAVSNGGTIMGVVELKGHVPPAKKLQVTKDQKACGKSAKIDPSLIVSGKDVANAVVYIKGIQKGKKMQPQDVTLNQKDCEYHPHVLAFPAGSSLEVLNPDGILHNIHSYSHKNSPFNIAQPRFKKKLTVKIDKPEIINIKCDVHAWMNGWLFAAESPYYSATDSKGSFKLTDVPPGTYTLEVWHETLGKLSKKVTVKPKEQVKVTFEFTKK